MLLFGCFSSVGGKKKGSKESIKYFDLKRGLLSSDHPNQPEEKTVTAETMGTPLAPPPALPKPMSNGNLSQVDPAGADAAYEGGDEHDEIASVKRDYSDLDLHARADSVGSNRECVQFSRELLDDKSQRDGALTPDLLRSGHVSDPGMGQKAASWGSPVLKRSCSNIETNRMKLQPIHSPNKSQSYIDLKNISADGNSLCRNQCSPLSAKSNCSADRVTLKKRSSSRVLPSRSRKVWWKLFLWSHRNLHLAAAFSKPSLPALASHQKAGYFSDTLEPSRTPDKGKKKAVEEPPNLWVAFAMDSSSPLDRINAWVNSIKETEFCPLHDSDYAGAGGDEDEERKGGLFFVNFPEVGESSGKNHSSHSHAGRRATEEIVQANHLVQSLSSVSSVAHISGMGLKVIPSISAFSSLRTVNLSGNFIVQINPASLPKSLHTLDLSRNKIATIEGLRGLTRLRVLNLSYNRIARIGHGLSNCTLIKELYLAGNKMSDVEGLHRLLKLSVLDLSFNKITTAKALGQLVANYHSLLALNLIGNPIQANIGDDQLRKTVISLLPHLTYLNKQPVKPQRAREAPTDSLARAALGSGSSGGRRTGRRTSQTSGGSSLARRTSQSSGLGSLGMAKGRSSDLAGHHKGTKHTSRARHQLSTTTTRK